MASFVLSFFPLNVLDEIWDLIESVSEGFLTYSFFCFGISVVLFDTPEVFMCLYMLFLTNPHLRFTTGLICDLFVSCVYSLMY